MRADSSHSLSLSLSLSFTFFVFPMPLCVAACMSVRVCGLTPEPFNRLVRFEASPSVSCRCAFFHNKSKRWETALTASAARTLDPKKCAGGPFSLSVIYSKHFICQFSRSLNQRCMKMTTTAAANSNSTNNTNRSCGSGSNAEVSITSAKSCEFVVKRRQQDKIQLK